MKVIIKRFVSQEYFGGLFLIFSALLALVVVNSPWQAAYEHLLAMPIGFHLGAYGLSKSFLMWVNEGLMSLFFFLVGLEIKRELFEGELNSKTKAALPLIGAMGGMLIPSLIFVALNYHHSLIVKGWAIPSATDIAFALGILSLFSKRLPLSIKVFLTALAIIDDLGAIVIIALFYSADLSLLALSLAGVCLLVLIAFNRLKITRFLPYLLIALLMWVCVLKSGMHATLTGVALAFCYPLRGPAPQKIALTKILEHKLYPWVNYLILPLFAFTNAGLPLQSMHLNTLFNSLPLAIILGLVLGKQLGIMGSCWLAIKYKWASLPAHTSWRHLYAAAILCGIGFTMSLFIGSLAYEGLSVEYLNLVRLGVLAGSLLSVIWGSIYIMSFCPKRRDVAECSL